MRIIHGKYKGFQFPPYQGDNTRPTTDLVKESLFNSLDSFLDIENASVIDLFAGTGNIGLECLSRGASSLISIDKMPANIRYMKEIQKKLKVENWEILKIDALEFVQNISFQPSLVFADPPYDYPQIHDLVLKVTESQWFRSGSTVFVIEHVDRLVFKHNHVFLKKQYGNTAFTCFKFSHSSNS